MKRVTNGTAQYDENGNYLYFVYGYRTQDAKQEAGDDTVPAWKRLAAWVMVGWLVIVALVATQVR